MLAVLLSFQMRSLGASEEFLQSDNLAESDRRLLIPPIMVKFSWAGALLPHEVNLMELPPPSHGFLTLQHLYGTRGAPLRRLMKLTKSTTQKGLRRMQSDIFTYSLLGAGESAAH